jgi:uncharacterized membrane protein
MKFLLRYLLIIFFVLAGCYHFINPNFYLGLIPNYFPNPRLINSFSGLVEIVFGLGLIFPKTTKWAGKGIIFLLICFIPSHVYFIQIGSCVPESLCVAAWISWTRLLLVHPLLMVWAWWVSQNS